MESLCTATRWRQRDGGKPHLFVSAIRNHAPVELTLSLQNFAANAARNVAEVLSGTAQHGAMVTHPFAGFSALASATIHLHL